MRRRSSKLSQGGALVAILTILVSPLVYAEDPTNPFNPPQSRISIPGGAGHQEPPTVVDLLWTWLQVRIGPPGG